ncbi:hypothetical protein K439DRAFT_1321414, partial [Ramaria rubella]
IKVHGVHTLPNGNIVVQVTEEQHAKLVLQHADDWTTHLAVGSTVSTKVFQVIASHVPTDFDPNTDIACSVLHGQNGSIISHPGNIVKLRWLHQQWPGSQPKQHSSLIVSLNDARVADEAILKAISVNGAICNVEKYVPSPTQCYRC